MNYVVQMFVSKLVFFTFQMVTPGPGTYGQGGIPQSSTERTSVGTVAMLDYGGNGSRSLPTEVVLTCAC